MKISCDEATKICDKNQYGEASFWDKIKLNIHLFLCEKCGLYSKQNKILTKCYDAHKGANNTHCLSEKDKKNLEKELKARI
ncbi:hypothetical protein [Lutibacter sp.]